MLALSIAAPPLGSSSAIGMGYGIGNKARGPAPPPLAYGLVQPAGGPLYTRLGGWGEGFAPLLIFDPPKAGANIAAVQTCAPGAGTTREAWPSCNQDTSRVAPLCWAPHQPPPSLGGTDSSTMTPKESRTITLPRRAQWAAN